MANTIRQTENQLIISGDEPMITIINYLWNSKPYEILLASNDLDFAFTFPRDGVYEAFQVTLQPDSLYHVIDNRLVSKETDEVIINFKSTEYDKVKIEKFIKDEKLVSQKFVRYTDLHKRLSEVSVEILDMEMSGCCYISRELIKERDLLRMTLIAISYFAELSYYKEIQRIIESFFTKISDCNYVGS